MGLGRIDTVGAGPSPLAVTIGGSDHPHISLQRLVSSDALIFTLLQDA
jgi:hypothetical protein